MAADGFWSNPEAARGTVAELKQLKTKLEPIDRVAHALEELELMLELAADDAGAEGATEAAALAEKAETALADLEFRVMLDGEHDIRAAFLSIQSAPAGTTPATGRDVARRCTCAGPSALATRSRSDCDRWTAKRPASSRRRSW
jgi:peptide chain release factor 2